ncbi:hypothetical protein RvY_13605 [Ramazzottius varieornatus]|uniref:Uncharacterized protein n=1 Tax=Ramazzottius varieornatus TaxID=947166 RepID=A0A1D1VNF6_RAMVA|nr:hypothetical protein RvY_13605 [Ramazzottius varieornatus]
MPVNDTCKIVFARDAPILCYCLEACATRITPMPSVIVFPGGAHLQCYWLEACATWKSDLVVCLSSSSMPKARYFFTVKYFVLSVLASTMSIFNVVTYGSATATVRTPTVVRTAAVSSVAAVQFLPTAYPGEEPRRPRPSHPPTRTSSSSTNQSYLPSTWNSSKVVL